MVRLVFLSIIAVLFSFKRAFALNKITKIYPDFEFNSAKENSATINPSIINAKSWGTDRALVAKNVVFSEIEIEEMIGWRCALDGTPICNPYERTLV